ncbi:prepilin-type N-terminal cleavage/methylation domain-containing protein [Patescibacteria group bacterium]|nr:prepilin-type N-terminal cleavage/methylation domain-containing protein [Patescibacteria group bacterium]
MEFAITTQLALNLKKRIFSPGFTLIELLIVISIIGIIFSFGIAQYTAFNRRQILDQSLAGLKSDLREAQSMALAGKRGTNNDNQCSGDLRGVMLDFSSSNSSYEIKSVCVNNEIVVKSIFLPTQITRQTLPETVLFKVITGTAEFLTLAADSTITLGGFGREASVVIGLSGEIR